jgi:LysR family hydrogen peroxide-inducible transcriptional activator
MTFAPSPFSFRQLQYAVAVADTLSFRKAAELCHVSQPALSAQLGQLEDSLGMRLFERDQRLVMPAAVEIIEQARRLLVGVADLLQLAKRTGDPLEGTLRIGVIPTISSYLLPTAARAIRSEYPLASIVWVEDKTETLVRDLESGALEAALLALEADIGDVEHEVVARDRFVIAGPPGHRAVKGRKPATAADLRGANVLLLNEGHCFREQALAICSEANAQELEFRATSLSTLAQMVAAGAGVTLLPELSLETECRRARLSIRPFAEPAPHRTIALVWRPRSPLGDALRQVAGTLRKAYPVSSIQKWQTMHH